MMELITKIQNFQLTGAYEMLFAIGANLGPYSGIVYFVLAMLAVYVLLRVGKFVVKVALALVVLYCGSGILVEYLPYFENLLKIF